MLNIKIIYFALAIVLTQTIRLQASCQPKKLDQSELKLYVGQKKVLLPLATNPKQNTIEKFVLVIAYFEASNLFLEVLTNQGKLMLAKDSLKVLFLKGITDFSPEKLQENCKNGVLVGAFEISKSWNSGKDANIPFLFPDKESYNWIKPLVLNIPKSISGLEREKKPVSSTPSFETKIPNLTQIGLSLSGFTATYSEESCVLKDIEGGTFVLDFTISVEMPDKDRYEYFKMEASTDANLLTILEEKCKASKNDFKVEGGVKDEKLNSSDVSEIDKSSLGAQVEGEPLALDAIHNQGDGNNEKNVVNGGVKKDSENSGNSNLASEKIIFWKSPCFYGGIFVGSIPALGLVIYIYKQREVESEDNSKN